MTPDIVTSAVYSGVRWNRVLSTCSAPATSPRPPDSSWPPLGDRGIGVHTDRHKETPQPVTTLPKTQPPPPPTAARNPTDRRSAPPTRGNQPDQTPNNAGESADECAVRRRRRPRPQRLSLRIVVPARPGDHLAATRRHARPDSTSPTAGCPTPGAAARKAARRRNGKASEQDKSRTSPRPNLTLLRDHAPVGRRPMLCARSEHLSRVSSTASLGINSGRDAART